MGFLSATTPGGNVAHFHTRDDTSDAALVGGILEADEYGLADLPPLSGWAIDIGAHIGIVAIGLALDHPNLRVVAVEALPENVEMLRRNIEANGLTERIFVEAAAAASEEEFADDTPVSITYGWAEAPNQPDHYMHDNRFIGGMVGATASSTAVACPPLSLGAILTRYGIGRAALLKIDCEGCEWFFLDSPHTWLCDRIYGEMHVGRHGTAERLRALLSGFAVEMDDSLVVAIFRARRIVRTTNAWPDTPRTTNAWPL